MTTTPLTELARAAAARSNKTQAERKKATGDMAAGLGIKSKELYYSLTILEKSYIQNFTPEIFWGGLPGLEGAKSLAKSRNIRPNQPVHRPRRS